MSPDVVYCLMAATSSAGCSATAQVQTHRWLKAAFSGGAILSISTSYKLTTVRALQNLDRLAHSGFSTQTRRFRNLRADHDEDLGSQHVDVRALHLYEY